MIEISLQAEVRLLETPRMPLTLFEASVRSGLDVKIQTRWRRKKGGSNSDYLWKAFALLCQFRETLDINSAHGKEVLEPVMSPS